MLGLVIDLYLIVLEEINIVFVEFALVEDGSVDQGEDNFVLQFLQGVGDFNLLVHYKSLIITISYSMAPPPDLSL